MNFKVESNKVTVTLRDENGDEYILILEGDELIKFEEVLEKYLLDALRAIIRIEKLQ